MLPTPSVDHPLLSPAAAAFDAPVAGVPTRFIVAPFADATLVAASQTGAVGTLLRVTRATGGGGGGGPAGAAPSFDASDAASTPPLLDVATLTGRRGVPALEACARALAARGGRVGAGRPLLVALALREDGADAVRGVLEALDGRV
jgi:hypothetical protein